MTGNANLVSRRCAQLEASGKDRGACGTSDRDDESSIGWRSASSVGRWNSGNGEEEHSVVSQRRLSRARGPARPPTIAAVDALR
jgi:hypothetical protein